VQFMYLEETLIWKSGWFFHCGNHNWRSASVLFQLHLVCLNLTRPKNDRLPTNLSKKVIRQLRRRLQGSFHHCQVIDRRLWTELGSHFFSRLGKKNVRGLFRQIQPKSIERGNGRKIAIGHPFVPMSGRGLQKGKESASIAPPCKGTTLTWTGFSSGRPINPS